MSSSDNGGRLRSPHRAPGNRPRSADNARAIARGDSIERPRDWARYAWLTSSSEDTP